MTLRYGYLAMGLLFCIVVPSADSSTDTNSPSGGTDRSLPPIGHTFFCQRYPNECEPASAKPHQPSAAADQLRELNAVNAKVNAAIAPKSDPDPVDRNWLIWPRQGDCDDYAVTKRHVLLQKGWPSSELLLAEVVLAATGEHHLVLVVRSAAEEWVLDNRKRDVVRFAELRDEYNWVRVEASDNPKFWNDAPTDLKRE